MNLRDLVHYEAYVNTMRGALRMQGGAGRSPSAWAVPIRLFCCGRWSEQE